jgi:cell division control protein 6
MSESEKKLYVLILDEFDVIMYDRRGNPSDFVYKLIEMQSDLVEKNIPTSIITISNNVVGDYEFDDRVRSRIGSSEIFFTPFSKVEILDILEKRAEEAFEEKIDGKVLEDIAGRCSDEHGDIRRAVELLRVSAELASIKKMPISEKIVKIAAFKLERDRLEETMETLSDKSKWVCFSLATLTHTTGKEWHSTMHVFEDYRKMLPPGSTQISYRRVSDLLIDLQNTGVVSSSTTSEGRNGYSSKYKLNMNPETVGKMISEERWQIELRRMKRMEDEEIVKKHIFGKKSLF